MKIFKVIHNVAVFTLLAIFVFNIASCSKASTSPVPDPTVAKSNLSQVISITFNQFTPAISATADNAGFWRVYTPNGTDLSHLTPTIVVSPKATISPASGTVWDFTANYTTSSPYNVLTFGVTAENGAISTHSIQAF